MSKNFFMQDYPVSSRLITGKDSSGVFGCHHFTYMGLQCAIRPIRGQYHVSVRGWTPENVKKPIDFQCWTDVSIRLYLIDAQKDFRRLCAELLARFSPDESDPIVALWRVLGEDK